MELSRSLKIAVRIISRCRDEWKFLNLSIKKEFGTGKNFIPKEHRNEVDVLLLFTASSDTCSNYSSPATKTNTQNAVCSYKKSFVSYSSLIPKRTGPKNMIEKTIN